MADTAKQQDAQGLSNRFVTEHDLLIKRTSAILTLNGLMATSIAVGDRFEMGLRAFVAVAMIVIDAAWLNRAWSARRFMGSLEKALHTEFADEDLPHDVRLFKKHVKSRKISWINTTLVFSVVIPLVLLLCWLAGLGFGLRTGASPATSSASSPGRFTFVPSQMVAPGRVLILDTQTGNVLNRDPKNVGTVER